MQFSTIILAAGKGSRFKSEIPKPLHNLANKPMLEWVIDLSYDCGTDDLITVIPKNSQLIYNWIKNYNFVVQDKPKGTGDAVLSCEDFLKKTKNEIILILYADIPLVKKKTIRKLLNQMESKSDLSLLAFETDNPNGYGRLITSDNLKVTEIIEDKEANKNQKKINLVNGGILAVKKDILLDYLPKVTPKNGEIYLTDLVKISNEYNKSISYVLSKEEELLGINDRQELAKAENILQKQLRSQAMLNGVTLIAPETVFLSADTVFEKDVIIEPNVIIGKNVYLSSGTTVKSFSHLEGIKCERNAEIGPFARLRSGTVLKEKSKIGNFVEIKNSFIGKNTKVNHLSYIGDAEISNAVNIGAGTITCNYGGKNKHKTKIGKGSFIGSNSSLIAPINIGENSIIGAGSTITENVENNSLSIERSKQIHKKKKHNKK